MVVNKGFLSNTKYLSYSIQIPHIRSNVRRQDEDFDLIQHYLVKVYPNVIVPTTKPYNSKKITEQKYMTKRATYTSRFLRALLRNRILRGDKYLLNFLTETDDKKYLEEKK